MNLVNYLIVMVVINALSVNKYLNLLNFAHNVKTAVNVLCVINAKTVICVNHVPNVKIAVDVLDVLIAIIASNAIQKRIRSI